MHAVNVNDINMYLILMLFIDLIPYNLQFALEPE